MVDSYSWLFDLLLNCNFIVKLFKQTIGELGQQIHRAFKSFHRKWQIENNKF